MVNLNRVLLVMASVTAIFIQGCDRSGSDKKTAAPEATFRVPGVVELRAA